ncbi:hypothetical protein XENORESO_009373 [Xenotaenia resolanae]|uniref:Uncharacterized protein n=1 Tax=Xenotaenia resolanae TaxID=208358 RepID=A0ABV0WKR3_9TELE
MENKTENLLFVIRNGLLYFTKTRRTHCYDGWLVPCSGPAWVLFQICCPQPLEREYLKGKFMWVYSGVVLGYLFGSSKVGWNKNNKTLYSVDSQTPIKIQIK